MSMFDDVPTEVATFVGDVATGGITHVVVYFPAVGSPASNSLVEILAADVRAMDSGLAMPNTGHWEYDDGVVVAQCGDDIIMVADGLRYPLYCVSFPGLLVMTPNPQTLLYKVPSGVPDGSYLIMQVIYRIIRGIIPTPVPP